jgi:class 3 adenylate cyclase
MIIDHNITVTITTLLTIWVLFCDDIRVLATDKPADPIFEAILIISLVVFGLEILLTCIGKDDYFMGFFFTLDVISTASLVLDLPTIQDDMASDDGSVGSASDGKTARIGAKAARVVRIVRLVRIVKLYKILITHFEKRIDAWMGIGPGEEDARMFEEEDEDEPKKKESRVGKQLSHATLKRVIILILAMLVVVPSLSASDTLKYPVSPMYGADEIGATFAAKQTNEVPAKFYENTLLRYIYYHNWYTGNGNCPSDAQCPNTYYNHLFWVGVSGLNSTAVQSQAQAARLRLSSVEAWDSHLATKDDLYSFGTMPRHVQRIMGSDWNVDCSKDRSDGAVEVTLGFSMIPQKDDKVEFTIRCPDDLRPAEYDRYYPRLSSETQAIKSHFVFYFDQRRFLKEQAAFGISVTAYVCVSLVIAIMFFSRDANRLVLSPVESMIAKVEKIRENPLAAVKMGDQEFKMEEAERLKKDRAAKRLGVGSLGPLMRKVQALSACGKDDSSKQPMETLILEKTLVKLGSLLALGLGEAGANIINKNMQSGDSADVDVMIQGTRVECIYGQAKIQDFSIITEVLASKVMKFVNQIAEIVHGVVVEYNGAANKNTGDTFLLVWRSNQEDASDLAKLADMSIAAFCKILASLQTSSSLAAYRGHPRIQSFLGANYRVNLNVGLHAGWAFEGAMGSEYKIDASYISPNIAITADIETATRHYRVPLLITEDVIRLCSTGICTKCRKIDTVHISGHHDELDLFCVDLDHLCLQAETTRRRINWNPRARYKVRQFLENERMNNWCDDQYALKTLDEDEGIASMREKYTEAFAYTFEMGLKNYSEGEWHSAQTFLVRACHVLGCLDGPSESLLAFMAQFKFEAPKEWRGFRDLGPLLQGPPKHPRRPSIQEPSAVVGANTNDYFDLIAQPYEGSRRPSEGVASWQLPNAVGQETLEHKSAGDGFGPLPPNVSMPLGKGVS